MSNTMLTTHTINIDNFKPHNKIRYTYAVDIQQYQNTANVLVTLFNIKFETELAIFIRHVSSLGQITVTVSNCSFTSNGENVPVAEHFPSEQNDTFNYDNNDTFVTEYGCNDYIDSVIIHYDSMVSGYFMNSKRYTNFNNIRFVDCSFTNINNSDISKLLDFSLSNLNAKAEYLRIFIITSLFYNNYYVKLMSIINYDSQIQHHYTSVFLKNVTVSSNTNDMNAIIAYIVTLYVENIKFIMNTFGDIYGIIYAKSSYIQFHGYSEFSNNNTLLAISSSSLYLQENTVLNFTSNTFVTIIDSDQPAIDDIKMCMIQYISKRGNLDKEFQQGHKLNYAIIFTNNSISDYEISTHYLTHCAWDSSSAFISSIPLQVNQRFITGDNFIVKESERLVCLCDKNRT